MAGKGATMEKEMTTRERILFEALQLFSKKGYDGVSMREIAAAVGIRGASIYNHFKGKKDIFEGIFAEMTGRYDAAAVGMNIPVDAGEQAEKLFGNADETMLMKMAEGLFEFFAKDEFTVMFRKLLVSEQHKNPLAGEYLQSYYFEEPIKFQTKIFQGILDMGGFKGGDAEIMALHFYSPMYYLLSAYDLGKDYEKCMEGLRKHIHWFAKCYK